MKNNIFFMTPELQKKIDEKWDACWPLSQLKPVIILDLISYLFFFKKVSENKLALEKFENFSDSPFSNTEETESVTWEVFKNLDTKSRHEAFTKKNGIIDSLKNYGHNIIFNEFTKGDLLLTPTPKLLAKSVEIIKIMENEDESTQAGIIEYLSDKIEIVAPNGQVYLPNYIVNLIISIIQPEPKDVIQDPAAGNGSLLAGCAKYIANQTDKNFKNNFDSQKLVGFESDLSNLRIGAMNMLLNNVENPNLKIGEPFSSPDFMSSVKPDVIVSDLIFSATENTLRVEGDSLKESTRKEILYLRSILNDSGIGTRLAIVVPAFILHNGDTQIKNIRQDIIDNFKLESVIYLEDKNFPHFLGSAILNFSKETSVTTDKVWLYKMKQSKKGDNNNLHLLNQEDDLNDKEEIAIIVSHFRNKVKNDETKDLHGIYIKADEIISNNYNLNYYEYNSFKRQNEIDTLTQIKSEKKSLTNDINEYASFVPAENKIEEPQKKPVKKIITIVSITILALCIALGSYWFFNPKKNRTIEKKNAAVSISYTDSTKDSIALNTPPSMDTNQKVNDEPQEGLDVVNEKYTIISKAYFYSLPNDNSRQNTYINHWSNAILIPQKEKDGFIYTVYDNKMGQKLSGWLNKKDLEIVH